jgi:hypothetical protein
MSMHKILDFIYLCNPLTILCYLNAYRLKVVEHRTINQSRGTGNDSEGL